jgi:Protein of unknown function (DUF2934)
MKTRIRRSHSAKENNPTKTTQRAAPTVEEIRQRAQEIFTARGGGPRNELDDWLQAEQELKQQSAGSNIWSTQ